MSIPLITSPDWSPSDVATVIIAAVALLVSAVSVISTFIVHRLQGALVRVKVWYHVDLRNKSTYRVNAPDPDKEPKTLATYSLWKAHEIYRRYPPDAFYATSFLRVIVTNAGRIDASVDSISYFNKEKKGIIIEMTDKPAFPVALPAQTYMDMDYLYSELREHAGKRAKIQFQVELTNGKHLKSRWIRLRADLSKPY